MKRKIELTIGMQDMTFNPTPELYAEYISSMARGDLCENSHNFVIQSSSCEEEKLIIKDLSEDNPGSMLQIASVIAAEFAPKLSIKVKK